MRAKTRVSMKAFDQLWRIREKELAVLRAKTPKGQKIEMKYQFPCLVFYKGCYTPSEQGGVYNGKDLEMTYTTADGKVVKLPFEKISYSGQP